MQTRQKLSILVTILGTILAFASIVSVVPRIRLVEAVGLFATAFGAGAGLTDTLVNMRRPASKR
jgi:hypothetical protein